MIKYSLFALFILIQSAGAQKQYERKIRNLLLLDKKIEMSAIHYADVKQYADSASLDWTDYIYFAFTTAHSFQEVLAKSRVLEKTQITKVVMQRWFDNAMTAPRIAPEIAGAEQDGVVQAWYREPGIMYIWCIGVKDAEGKLQVIGICSSLGLPTSGFMPGIKFDKKGNKMTSKNAQQPGADQPATKPADKVPAEVQPPTPTPKDAPR